VCHYAALFASELVSGPRLLTLRIFTIREARALPRVTERFCSPVPRPLSTTCRVFSSCHAPCAGKSVLRRFPLSLQRAGEPPDDIQAKLPKIVCTPVQALCPYLSLQ
jgi:hypothetical protein